MEISKDVLEFLKKSDVQNALIRNDMQELYKLAENPYLGDLTIGELTNILIQAGIDPLQGMTEIPTCFLYMQEGIKEFNIPQGITKINSYAFAHAGLRSITIPSTVGVIEAFAFHKCENLKTVKLPTGMELYGGAFSFAGLESIELRDVKLQDYFIFHGCKQLKSVAIKGDTPVIPDRTFKDCTNLTHVELPETLEQVGYDVFYGCDKLREINFAGIVNQWKNIEINESNGALFGCKIICSDGTLKYDDDVVEWIEV